MKKSSKSSLKKKGLLIYLSSIKTKLAINFLKKKKNFLQLADFRAGAEKVNITKCMKINPFSSTRRAVRQANKVKVKGLGLNNSYLA